MKKILVLFHPLKQVSQYLEKEGDAQFAPHHFWLFDHLKREGHQVDFVDANPKTLLNRIGDKLRLNFLQQQVDTLKIAKDYDLIFVPYIDYSFFLSLLKVMKIFKKPLVGLAHHPYYHQEKNLFKKVYYDSIRYIYFKGMDDILYYSQPILEKSNQGSIQGNCSLLDNFGIDFDFFDSFVQNQQMLPTADYIYSSGGSKRDYDTLVQAFEGIDFDLKITTSGGNLSDYVTHELPPNVHVDNSLPFGLGSTGKIRSEYYNALAVAVPLREVNDYLFGTWGLTVVLEGMAMGKPIVSTHNDAYHFNLEKEKIGFYVDYGDVQGWQQAINYLISHPEEAKEMGERARYLCKTKYNYKLFAKNAMIEMNKILKVDPKAVTTIGSNLVKNGANVGVTASSLLQSEWIQLF